MNKTKKVAWHKQLRKAKKIKEKQRQAQKSGAVVTGTRR
jgi:ribosomal protein L7Ae-like RNA K-turn-binding protein